MKRSTVAAAGLFAALSAPAFAADRLFTGIVERQIVQSSGTADCAAPVPVTSAPLPNGGTRITVSNAGGCLVAEIKVLHDFNGDKDGQVQKVKSRLGEFSQLSFPSSGGPLLIHLGKDTLHWSPVYTENGVDLFNPSFLKHFPGLDAAAFHPDANGRIPVSELASQLQP